MLEKSVLDEKVEEYNRYIYSWSIRVVEGDVSGVLRELQEYIVLILNKYFSQSIIDKEFIYGSYSSHNDDHIANVLKGNELLLSSVHGVKGQTHLATLYMESFYFSEYESTLMKDVFSGVSSLDLIEAIEREIKEKKREIVELKNSGKRGVKTREENIRKLENRISTIKKYSKMLYVGFSRPTHLLAFALEETRFNELVIDEDVWSVSYV